MVLESTYLVDPLGHAVIGLTMLSKLKKFIDGFNREAVEFWLKPDGRGGTNLHRYARRSPEFGFIPPHILTAENLAARDSNGVPAIVCLLNGNRVGEVDKKELTDSLFGLTFSPGSVVKTDSNEPVSVLNFAVEHCRHSMGAMPGALFVDASGELTDLGHKLMVSAAKFDWTRVPSDLLITEHLTKCRKMDNDNSLSDADTTYLHVSATYNNLQNLPEHLLTAQNLTFKNALGSTVIHNAIGWKFISKLPESAFTIDVLLAKNSFGSTVLESIVGSTELAELPPGYLAKNLHECLEKEPTILHRVAKAGHLDKLFEGLDWEAFEPFFAGRDDDGLTVLHIAAANGNLCQIPRCVMTHDNMMLAARGLTVYHEAAVTGTIDQVPVELLTDHVLRLEPEDGKNPLWWKTNGSVLGYALRSSVRQFVGAPHRDEEAYVDFVSGLVTVENLLIKDYKEKNLIQAVVESGMADRIPVSLPVPETYKAFFEGSDWWDRHVAYKHAMGVLGQEDKHADMDLF